MGTPVIDTERNTHFFESTITLLIIATLISKFILNLKFSINLDEFHYLSYVYQYKDENLNEYFGTFHALLFAPFLLKSSNEIITIVEIRTFLFFLFLGNCYFTYYVSRVFLDRLSSLFATLCYISFSYVYFNASSFRYDSLCSFLFLFSLFLLCKLKYKNSVIATCALLLSISLMLTIKSIFHVLCFSAFFFTFSLTVQSAKLISKKLSLFIIALSIIYLVLNLLYGALAFNNPFKYFLIIENTIKETYPKFIVTSSTPKNIMFLLISLRQDFLIWAMIALGGVCFFRKYCITNFKNLLLWLSLLSTLIFLIFYRNTFPYFYLFIMSPPIIFTGFCISALRDKIVSSKSKISDLILSLILLMIFSLNILNFKLGYSTDNAYEKQLVDVVHRIYPEPVNYIDGCSMISSFNKVGLFTSSAGMEAYLSNNTPIFRSLLLSKVCSFLIVNTEVLDLSKTKSESVSIRGHSLLKDDWEVLNDNFIQYWGLIYTPGKVFEFNDTDLNKEFDILIPGIYTVESENPVIINGLHFISGETINLTRGHHKISTLLFNNVILRFGNHMYKPDFAPFPLEYIRSRFY
jgi:hypothetical protein